MSSPNGEEIPEGFVSQENRELTLIQRTSSSSPPILRRVAPDRAERQASVPRLGDVWVPKSAVSSNHFSRFYIPGVEDLYQEGDRVLRVQHSGSRSRLISWRIWKHQDGGVAAFLEMTSPQGLDDLFWGREYEDVNDWAEWLTMAAEVRDLTLDKLFKIAKLNLRGRAKEWFRRLQPAPAD
ncbi:unnamed protein product [Sphagnum troendelagicum]|uniref:Uncharacterized protein n=1 Tax=Sphagnum troendelagicum TaxID=128251 RepID=A0ABP0V568_9BRYO